MRCSSIAVRRSTPLTVTNYPSKTVEIDNPNSIYVTVAKDNDPDVNDCHIVFFNQDSPYIYNIVSAPFIPAGRTNEIGRRFLGFQFGSFQYIGKMLGASDGNRTSETAFIGHGIYFWEMNHSIEKRWDWWTLQISLLYPIILFSILPAIFAVKKLRGRKSASIQKATVEKNNC